MTHQKNDTQDENQSQVSFEAIVREKLQQAVRTAFISVLEEEVDAFIGAVRYERSEHRRDYRNGHYARSLQTSLGRSTTCRYPVHGEAITHSCSNAIIVVAVTWIKRSGKCLSVG